MTEREKLIKLIETGTNLASKKAVEETARIVKENHHYNSATDKTVSISEMLADYLLENGVIVPVPAVEIGTTVYEIRQKGIGFSNRRYDSGITTQKQLKNAIFDGKTLYIQSKLYAKSDNVRLGNTVFLTREEAEKALEERKNENETR